MRLCFDIPDDEYRKIEYVAYQRGIPLEEMVRRLVREEIRFYYGQE